MFEIKSANISVKRIASFLKHNYLGKNFNVSTISSLDHIKNNSIVFYSRFSEPDFKVKDSATYDLKKLKNYKNVVLICDKETKKNIRGIPVIISKNPRLDYSRIVMKFFVDDEFKPGIHSSAIIEKESIIGKNAYIGPFCYIGKNVKIGNNVKILSNSSIFGKTEIGSNSIILSNTTIGSEGFGFSFDGKNSFHFPHIGSVLIGKNVWVGSNTTIEKSAIDKTIIEAARDMGAKTYQIFWEIILPLSLPGVAIGMVFIFVMIMGEFATAVVVYGGKTSTVGTVILNYYAVADYPFAAVNAIMLMLAMMIGVVIILRLVNIRKEL